MKKSCITLISFCYQDTLAFNIPEILAKPELWPQHQKHTSTRNRALSSCSSPWDLNDVWTETHPSSLTRADVLLGLNGCCSDTSPSSSPGHFRAESSPCTQGLSSRRDEAEEAARGDERWDSRVSATAKYTWQRTHGKEILLLIT